MFFERILGAFTAPPTRLEPVSHIPHAAPTTEKPNPTTNYISTETPRPTTNHITTKSISSSSSKAQTSSIHTSGSSHPSTFSPTHLLTTPLRKFLVS